MHSKTFVQSRANKGKGFKVIFKRKKLGKVFGILPYIICFFNFFLVWSVHTIIFLSHGFKKKIKIGNV